MSRMRKLSILGLVFNLAGCSAPSEAIKNENAQKIVEEKHNIDHLKQEQLCEYTIDVKVLSQFPEYPTGCEVVSTIMLLQYFGEGITVEEFIDQYLEMDTLKCKDDTLYGPSPYDCFIGDPRSEESYGCFASVIEKSLEKYYQSKDCIDVTTGMSLENLCQLYINQDIPVIVWASIAMEELFPSTIWTTLEGESFEWLGNEHCLLLVGYDEAFYYFNDPWYGEVKAYEKEIVEDRYETLGRQSLTVKKSLVQH